jgi:hypothetical protein
MGHIGGTHLFAEVIRRFVVLERLEDVFDQAADRLLEGGSSSPSHLCDWKRYDTKSCGHPAVVYMRLEVVGGRV